jgi:hypothetical protein
MRVGAAEDFVAGPRRDKTRILKVFVFVSFVHRVVYVVLVVYGVKK